MKHRLTALFALAAVVAAPTIASAAPLIYPDTPARVSTDDHLAVIVPASTIASAAPLIYPDIPAKLSMDDHYAVLVPIAGAVTASHQTAAVVPSNNDPSQALASADTTYITSMCPTVMAHPGDHSKMLNRFCQNGQA